MKTQTSVCGPSQSGRDGLPNILAISDDLVHSDLVIIVNVQLRPKLILIRLFIKS